MHQFLIHSDALPLTLPAPDLEPCITFAINETESLQVDTRNTTERMEARNLISIQNSNPTIRKPIQKMIVFIRVLI